LTQLLQLVPALYEGEAGFEIVRPGLVPGSRLAPIDLTHLTDKTVASAWNRLDIFLPGGRFAEGLAQNRDVVGKVALFDNGVRPNAMDELIFVNEAAMRFNEYTESLEDLCAQRDWLSVPG
jgi:hypothetical protein